MRVPRRVSVGAAIAIVAAGAALVPATPAAAAVVATTSGTVINIAMTGSSGASFSCNAAGKVVVTDVVPAPALACTALTEVNVTGDGGPQYVFGNDLSAAAFTKAPRLVASLGDGADALYETRAADVLDAGPGNDVIVLYPTGPSNISATLGSGTIDRVTLFGTDGDDTVIATSTSATVTIAVTGATTATRSVTGAERIALLGNAGDDVLDTTGVTFASTITDGQLSGAAGDDVLRDGSAGIFLEGGAGTNQLRGGAGPDEYRSTSPTDVLIDASDGAADEVHDVESRLSGGRTLSGFDGPDALFTEAPESDTIARIRPGAGGAATLTLSLNRSGQQQVPASVGTLGPSFDATSELTHRALLDVVAIGQDVEVRLPSTGPGLLDVTIPTGTWVVSGTDELVISSNFGTIRATNVDDHRVHGPWTNRNLGFAHRVTRDMLFRFGSSIELLAIGNALDEGDLTRAQLVAQAMGTDEYRGLDVDRVFQRYLRRTPDPGGRTFWINSLRNGKALWRFRAQLFGSAEYFTQAGGTNAAYVRRAYQDVLGRLPDPSGEAFWTNRLNGGADRGSVALQFINSPEARRRLVDDQFLRFLDRLPTPSEQTTWVNQIPTDDGELRLIAFLAGSNAYYTRT